MVINMNSEKIGKFIKKLRKDNNLTQKDLADKYNVTYQAVSKWENGLTIPDISLLKEMSKDFNIDLEDLLEGRKTIKNNRKYLLLLIPLIIIITIILLPKKDNFEFKTLSTTCSEFNVSGSIAYNDSKSQIYISNINYCGGNDNNLYKEINCILYESTNNVEIKIGSDNYKGSITLENYLKNVKFNIDNYKSVCKDYKKNSLILRIDATTIDNKIVSYKIPLTLKDNC